MSDGEIATIEEIVEEMLKCKLNVHTKIEDLEERVWEKLLMLEEAVAKSNDQRVKFNDETQRKIDRMYSILTNNKREFSKHTIEEMEKYTSIQKTQDNIQETQDEIKDILETLVKDTENNSEYISRKEHEDSIDAEVDKRIAAKKNPYKEHAIKSAIAIGVGSVLLIVWKLVQIATTPGVLG